SGMPEAVDIPAPVSATIDCAAEIISASDSIACVFIIVHNTLFQPVKKKFSNDWKPDQGKPCLRRNRRE
ncbi:MAG: hypothetical protein PWQ29_1593, partial [Verrucomicrobiota bacterium]|nr:hypothetical protein [Verrucomicrobiota bacterium]